MKNSISLLLLFIGFLFLIGLPTSSNAQMTWTGNASSNWNDPANWSPAGLPNLNTDVVINNRSNDPIILHTALARSVEVNSGAILTVNNINGQLIIDNSSDDGITNVGRIENYGAIMIGAWNKPMGDAILNNNIIINAGTITIMRANHSAIDHHGGTFTNTGRILIGQGVGTSIDESGIRVSGGTNTRFVNDGGSILIDNIAGDLAGSQGAIQCYEIFENKNNGEILIGQSSGNIDAIGIYNSDRFFNDNSIIRIDNVEEEGISVGDDGANFVNRNGGSIIIGETGNVNRQSIEVESGGNFQNQSCSILHLYKQIRDDGTFTNESLIVEEATGNSDISTNTGVVQNLNGGTFTIDTDNGDLTSQTGSIWIGCENQDWLHQKNWYPEQVPTTGDKVFLFSTFATAGNEPNIYVLDEAYAKSVRIETGAELTINYTGKLIIDGSSGDGFFNNGIVNNSGEIEIGLSASIGSDGIDNRGTFNNTGLGIIRIENTTSNGLYHYNGTFSNSGNIIIGSIDIGAYGIYSRRTFNNDGYIHVKNADSDGIYIDDGDFTNNQNITIGKDGSINGYGINNKGTFNNAAGILDIKRTTGIFSYDGIKNMGIFTNSATIHIGNTAEGVLGNGIFNDNSFENLSGTINIDNTVLDGINNNTAATFTNKATINIGSNREISRFGISNNAIFDNNNGGQIYIDQTDKDGIYNIDAAIFTNKSNIHVGSNSAIDGHGLYNEATFENNGSSLYIDQTSDDGIHNIGAGIFTNKSNLYIGSNSAIGGYGIFNEATFANNAGKHITIADVSSDGIYNALSGDFNNKNTASILSYQSIINNGGTFTNNGELDTDVSIENTNNGLLKGNGTYIFENEWVSNATFQKNSSTVIVKGSLDAKIKGSAPIAFYNLRVDKGGSVDLHQAISISNQVQMYNGVLDLNGFDLTLDTNGEIDNEWAFGRITGANGGEVIKTVSLNAPNNENPGNMGITITSSADLGTTILKRGHVIQSVNGTNSIKRYYDISPANNSGLDATVRFSYHDSELNSIAESDLEIFQLPSTGAWQYYETMAADQSSNYVEISGVHSFSTYWTLSEADVKLQPIALFQGGYEGAGLMNDNLRSQGLLPTTEPFTGLGFTHVGGGGEQVEATVFEITGENAIVDWIFLQIRDKSNSELVVNTRSALIQRDGDIVDLNGISPISFPNITSDDYYLAVLHRNHIGIMSSAIVNFNRTAGTYDFTLDPLDTEGGLLGVADLGDGFYGLFSGDHNANGQIQNTDAVGLTNTIGLAGYLAGDIDLNGQIQNSELQLNLVPNIGKGAQFNY